METLQLSDLSGDEGSPPVVPSHVAPVLSHDISDSTQGLSLTSTSASTPSDGSGGSQPVKLTLPFPTVPFVTKVPTIPSTSRKEKSGMGAAGEKDDEEGLGGPASGFSDEVAAVRPERGNVQMSLLQASDIVDLDIDALCLDMEEHSRALSKAVVNRFLEVKRKMLLREQQALREENGRGSAKLAEKEKDLEEVRCQLAEKKRRAERMVAMASRAADLIAQRAEQQRVLKLLMRAMWRWKAFARQQKRTRVLLRKSNAMYTTRFLLGKALRKWVRFTHESRRANAEGRAERRIQQIQQRLVEENAAHINELNEALSLAKSEVAHEQEKRRALEENMKQAFMRGVCALNIEAMALLKKPEPSAPLGDLSNSNEKREGGWMESVPAIPSDKGDRGAEGDGEPLPENRQPDASTSPLQSPGDTPSAPFGEIRPSLMDLPRASSLGETLGAAPIPAGSILIQAPRAFPFSRVEPPPPLTVPSRTPSRVVSGLDAQVSVVGFAGDAPNPRLAIPRPSHRHQVPAAGASRGMGMGRGEHVARPKSAPGAGPRWN